MYSSVFINDNMNSGGLFSYKPTLLEKGVISVKNYDNVIPLIHEIFHAKQLKDGASSLVELQHYSRLTNEAAAKGLNLILEVKTKDMFLENETAIDTLWVKKILCKRLTNLQTNKLLTDAEHCYGEEETIGIIMHCLLENNPKKREEHLKYFCGDIFTSKDFQSMNEECEDWRASYVNEKILQKETDLEKTLNHAPNTVNEISLVPFFNAYNSNETHIPQTFESIKIRKNQHQNVLAKFLAQESQHTK